MSNTKRITNTDDIFKAFSKVANVARALRVKQSTASEMKRRKSIPVEYWPALVEAAAEIGRADITLEKLVEITAEADRRKRQERAGAAA